MIARRFISNLQRQLRQAPRPHTSSKLNQASRQCCRHQSTSSGPGADASSRASRIISRLPRPLQKYASRLRNAPMTHVVAFLALHEITAVAPLLGLFGLFHYTDFVPVGYMTEHYGAYVGEGLRRFERYFRRKGWFGFGEEAEGGEGAVADTPAAGEGALDRWQSDGKYKFVVEIALAYAITKVLLPVRIMGSLWATPWFAGVLGRIGTMVRPKRPPR